MNEEFNNIPPTDNEDTAENKAGHNGEQSTGGYSYGGNSGSYGGYSYSGGYTNPDNNWNYQDYSQVAVKPAKKKKAGKTVAIVLSSIVAVVMLGLAAYGGISLLNGFMSGLADKLGNSSLGSGINNNASENGIYIQEGGSAAENVDENGNLTVPGVIAKVKPSVVGVVSYKQMITYEPYSVGSGIIMSEKGYIVTNAHVVADCDSFKVVLYDSTEYDAVLIGSDTKTDLAVLKIEAQNLVKATFGNSEKVEAGETVIAIGNPGGLELSGSSTMGIVSATNRYVKANATDGFSMKCIQTDAAINPGNSGGALVNMLGQVIGINSSKFVADGYEGIGFAISINEAQPIVDDLLTYGYVKDRAKIGISVSTVDEWTAKMNDVPVGVLISAVESGTDAAGKLKKGDIIVELGGQTIASTNDLFAVLQNHKANTTVKIKVYRTTTKQYVTVDVKLGEDKGNS